VDYRRTAIGGSYVAGILQTGVVCHVRHLAEMQVLPVGSFVAFALPAVFLSQRLAKRCRGIDNQASKTANNV
jgi:hypothetical protein